MRVFGVSLDDYYMAQRLLLVAGEASGDLHGGNLARALLAQQPTLQLLGVGGRRMREAGVELLFDIRDLSVVGAVEAVRSLRTLWTAYHTLLGEVERTPVDTALLIDFPGFNLKLAKALAQRGIPVLYYIAPQVWAWRPGRMNKIQRRVRKLFVILPFEAALYHEAHIDAEFVGHPLLDLVQPSGSKADACTRCGLDPAAPVVGILPGSRRSELQYLLRPMLEAAAQIRAQVAAAQFIVPLAETLQPLDVQEAIETAPIPVRLVQRQTYDVMQAADVLLVASGTATLEAALIGTPMVLVYKAHLLTYLLARLVMRVSRIGLPNIIAGRAIVPELWQYDVTADNMAAQALALLTSPERATAMRTELATLRSQLGAPGVPERVASGLLRYLDTRVSQPTPGPRWEIGRSMHPALHSLISPSAAWLVKAICATLRVQVVRGEIEQTVRAQRRNVIYAFWHGHLLYLMYRYRGSGVYILVSQSEDGEVLSRILQRFGLPTIRGSSSRGGRRSLLELVRRARAGASAAIAPDGPRGPRQQAQLGIITLARLTEIPIIPLAVGARWKIVCQSWDCFLLPLPGSRVIVAYGEPVVVPSDADPDLLEQKRQELEGKLLKLTEEVTLATRA